MAVIAEEGGAETAEDHVGAYSEGWEIISCDNSTKTCCKGLLTDEEDGGIDVHAGERSDDRAASEK